jgi:hypothetical protein
MLDAASKADLFRRIAAVIGADGRFVLADVVMPVNPTYEVTAINPHVDHLSTLDEQLVWLKQANLQPQLTWSHRDLVVIVGTRPDRGSSH